MAAQSGSIMYLLLHTYKYVHSPCSHDTLGLSLIATLNLFNERPSKTASFSQDVKEFLDGSKHGVIVFSLGSSIRAETFPPQKRDAFIQAFSELPQRVLWKWEGQSLPGQPKNVKTVVWLPQMDVLGILFLLVHTHRFGIKVLN
jgi:hypothetical protein